MRNVFLLLLVLTVTVQADDRLSVYTVNYPLQYFAERIAGERAEVIFPGPANEDPASWTPSREILEGYQKADLILLNGASYAKWVDKASLPRARTIDTSTAFQQEYIQSNDPVSHSHGPGGDHSHTGTAFTTWLDLYQASQQAEAILKALSKKRPAYKAEFENRYEALHKDLMQLDLDIQKLLAKQPNYPLFASHPVYQYFARRYQLHMESVLWEPDVVPAEKQWQQLLSAQEALPASWMLWESEPVAETRQRLEKHGIHSVVFDTCANTPDDGDFMSVMRANIDRLGKVFQ